MELRICCEKRIDITNLLYLKEVTSEIKNYDLDGSTLNGNVIIYVKYQENEDQEETKQDIVPFTVLFRKENSIIENIEVVNLKYYDIVNEGVQCNFDVIIYYNLKMEENNNEEEIEEIESEDNEDDTIEEIKEKYDNLLKNVFTCNNDKEEVGNEENITVNVNNNVEIEKLRLKISDDKMGLYRVYYPKKESDIDKLCLNENVSVASVYNYNSNKDFINKKRIIIKK